MDCEASRRRIGQVCQAAEKKVTALVLAVAVRGCGQQACHAFELDIALTTAEAVRRRDFDS